ncbi:FitA-like ribbon-helix-helix domain-containing protein [Nocardioides sp. Bht2]|uniref:FitA-like ribbon-helix-helix domain-containing protein n=1 Tax=Nocardioides sp. Bht2 TaxID=3392297 RepID=UPI0039B5AE38
MPALHVRDVPEDTVAALKRRAARHGHSVKQELREVLNSAAREPLSAELPRRIDLQMAEVGPVADFDRAEHYGDDER